MFILSHWIGGSSFQGDTLCTQNSTWLSGTLQMIGWQRYLVVPHRCSFKFYIVPKTKKRNYVNIFLYKINVKFKKKKKKH